MDLQTGAGSSRSAEAILQIVERYKDHIHWIYSQQRGI